MDDNAPAKRVCIEVKADHSEGNCVCAAGNKTSQNGSFRKYDCFKVSVSYCTPYYPILLFKYMYVCDKKEYLCIKLHQFKSGVASSLLFVRRVWQSDRACSFRMSKQKRLSCGNHLFVYLAKKIVLDCGGW